MRGMKNVFSIVSTLVLGSALALSACNKDKKPAATDPAKTEPAAMEPAKPADGAAKPADPAAKPDEAKPASGGW
jgi:ABC-type oligopeptide transport system substrate-binding subunit